MFKLLFYLARFSRNLRFSISPVGCFMAGNSLPKLWESEAPVLDISATFIRKQVRNNKSIRYLVPEAVEQMIKSKGFYLK